MSENDWTNETAEWYAEKYGEYETNRLAIEYLSLPGAVCVVDIGCGTGCALRFALEKNPTITAIGIDPVPRMIEIAKERLTKPIYRDNISFKVGSAERIPIPDGSADIVLAFDSFDHWNDNGKGLNEVRRILKSNGIIIFVKDTSVSSQKGNRLFESTLTGNGFSIEDSQQLNGYGVSCYLWVCKSF